MSDLRRKDSERVPRQKAAERLTDLAYALTVGDRLDLSVDGERLSVPLADDVLLERDLEAGADRVDLELSLSWPNEDDDDPLSDGIARAPNLPPPA
jgi:amphi-Trp domain-containing protein